MVTEPFYITTSLTISLVLQRTATTVLFSDANFCLTRTLVNECPLGNPGQHITLCISLILNINLVARREGTVDLKMANVLQDRDLCLQTNEEFKPLTGMNGPISAKSYIFLGITVPCLSIPHFLHQGSYLDLEEL